MRSGTHRRVAPGGGGGALCQFACLWGGGVIERGWEGCPGEGRGVESRGGQKERAGITTGLDKA